MGMGFRFLIANARGRQQWVDTGSSSITPNKARVWTSDRLLLKEQSLGIFDGTRTPGYPVPATRRCPCFGPIRSEAEIVIASDF